MTGRVRRVLLMLLAGFMAVLWSLPLASPAQAATGNEAAGADVVMSATAQFEAGLNGSIVGHRALSLAQSLSAAV
ncbi:hypothetical protein ACIRYZ_43700, partial [Kitasatospora sp. NPDC101155]|uniref:hypothetical protein n=1 Tax=Kitasatospora sp. NPDC101155 TaxID=3364097 RepID=UPI0037F255C9